MSRAITVAAIQMDGSPAPKDERLQRAADLIAAATIAGADLIVLPEYFVSGFHYHETHYEQTETVDGATLDWLRGQAAQHGVHIAGTSLVVEHDDTYQAAFLVAPDGRQWRYDKHYPYLWERVFFRDGDGLLVADTALGRIGVMIGWDAAHRYLWERYAAKIDLLIIPAAVPSFTEGALLFPDGVRIAVNDLGFAVRRVSQRITAFLHDDLNRQAQWSQIPVVIAGASGEFSSILPAPFFSMSALFALRPEYWQKVDEHHAEAQLQAPFEPTTRIVNRYGETIASVANDGDSFAMSTLELPERLPQPVDGIPQPASTIPAALFALVDGIIAGWLTLTYRRGVRRQWGARMARGDDRTRFWLWLLGLTALVTALLTRFLSRPRR